MLKNRNCCQSIMLLYVIVHEEFTTCSTLSHGDCFIRVYRLFTTIFYKCLITININFTLPIMLALCLMLSVTHYAQNYAGNPGI